MKYIIDTDDFKFTLKTIVVMGVAGCVSKSVDVLEELTADYINEHYGSLQDDAYKRGLEEGKAVNDKGCEGCKLQGTDSNICDQCCNSYANQWKANDGKIEVGDEVVWTEDENAVIVVTNVYTDTNMEWCDGVCKDGKAYSILTKNARKTGRHFDIQSILEAMKA